MVSKKIELVKQFYHALDKGDYKSVIDLYHAKAIYRDELFDLQGLEIHALWYRATRPEMNFSAKLESIREEGDVIKTDWEIGYTLDVIKRRIKLKEIGTFKFEDDKIIEHTDEYDFWSWCTQVLGPIGRVFGWSNWLKSRARYQARKSVLAHLYSAQSLVKLK